MPSGVDIQRAADRLGKIRDRRIDVGLGTAKKLNHRVARGALLIKSLRRYGKLHLGGAFRSPK